MLLSDPDDCMFYSQAEKETCPAKEQTALSCACMCYFSSFLFSLSWRRQTPGNDYGMWLQVEIDPEAPVARGGGGGPFPFHTTLTMQSHASVIKSTCRFSCRRVTQGLYTCFYFICCFCLFCLFVFLKNPPTPMGLIKH